MRYYAVKVQETIRLSDKVGSPAKAALYCYGSITPEMLVIDLGTRKQSIQTDSWLRKRFESKDWTAPFQHLSYVECLRLERRSK